MVAVLVAWISVGNTPLLDLSALAPDLPKGVRVLGKAEFSNPSGSVKDRIVEYILDEQERIGRLTRFSGPDHRRLLVGQHGTSLAMFSALRGYRCIAITNRGTSKEKVQQLYAYGAEVVVTASGVPTDSPVHYQNVEKQLVEENPGYFGLNQYDSPLNPEAYYATLGPELWAQTNGKITHLVAAGSTGGTVSGTARFLKKKNQAIQVIMPDPHGSIFYDWWAHRKLVKPTSFEGLDLSLIDVMPRFSDEQAFATCRTIARRMGMMVGGSAGGNVHAALTLARKLKGPATVVAILCDSGTKYLSKIFNDEWMASKGYDVAAMDASAANIPHHPKQRPGTERAAEC
ncbi:hypothetical protein EMIHUDRAFT_310822 [Emiliania huxleyi CCMP1516]|uniref:Tryptophan synthase beta chain-like PALP domain-containing protein n=2 Tax=Emiliania huxleyi TaxID=2903 RepID=A0A0D3J1Q2_EMIH1|nr:hypothetical protein EMIHUDRAFT_310822 [Emiliania huxleyi CCMP1516]EOD17437.1 hypothetical protein EMIHUDRAFT_310822 [Emiliania huxleyi CCMP1516]|eukprot:XP_005769866.1 hypothetical protein EMIHUDRAFT_310822 [Emiliania huxleyi CCMP1516]